jgi:hypothetical protein
MNNIMGQVLALIGVLIGICGTIIATAVADRSRWKRQTTIRWDERRLDAYAQYAKIIKEIHQLTLRLIAVHASLKFTDPIDRESGLQILLQAEERRTTQWENVLLLGDAATVSAAREWRNAVGQLERYARDYAVDDLSAKVLATVRRVNEARDLFYMAARNSIGVSGGSVEQAPWLLSASPGAPHESNADSDDPKNRAL